MQKVPRHLPLLPCLPLMEDSHRLDERARCITLMASMNEEPVAHCNGKPNAQPHERHHLDVRLVPLLAQIRCHPLLCHFCLSPYHAMNRVNHWGEVFVQLMATCEVLLFLLFFLIRNNLHRVLVPIAESIRISDTEVENTQTATLPKVIDAAISTLLVNLSKSGWLLLLTKAMLLYLLLLHLLLLLYLLLHHGSCWVCWGAVRGC